LTNAPTEAADTNRSNHVVDTSPSNSIVAKATPTTASTNPQTHSGSAFDSSSPGVSRALGDLAPATAAGACVTAATGACGAAAAAAAADVGAGAEGCVTAAPDGDGVTTTG